ncbi:MAG: hypothetical protein A3F10_03345 [Coxiella sp. RIFCSPHIGHO2_12_FULL_42_15]|nr:MAG: hypothetical protein A3F10_03345 [Coxiella sp. RIFCSPHIGHO2_12_FULL_42_15]
MSSSSTSVSGLRRFGAVLLIVGTSIGGGMLALPIATATMGLVSAIFYLFLTWFLMVVGALLIVEVNAWLPESSNLISMAGKTTGKFGQALAWVAYLLLLYSLLPAYIAGGQEVVVTILHYMKIKITPTTAVFIFLILFSIVVYSGIRHVDWMNRLIMAVKLVAYLAMIAFALPFVHGSSLIQVKTFGITMSTAMIMITSYGFAIIVPSLRTYLNNNIRVLRRTVIIGSFIPLIFYLLWECVIFGVLPERGANSLQSLAESQQPVSTLMQTLGHLSHFTIIGVFANIFTSVCVITAFLGVSLCLLDFLADGLNVKKNGGSGIFLYLLTFIPPLLLALFAQKVFIYALSFAGIFCVFLLILQPAWMAWVGRYYRQFPYAYRVLGGKFLLLVLISVSLLLLGMEVALKIFSMP